MGAKLCIPRHPISDQISESPPGGRDGRSRSSSFKEFIKPECVKRKIEMETPKKKIHMAKKLTLQDWILASPPGLKPDYLIRGEHCAFKQSKKKVHPCASQLRRSLIGEAKDSLCLDRPMYRNHGENEGISNCSSSISRSLRGKSHKKVSFKLPHIVILYSPEEPYCNEASLCSEEEQKPYNSEDSIFSLMGPNCRENSFDSAEEPFIRLAVDTLPHVSVSSRF